MRPPIVVTGDGDALVFDSPEAVGWYLDWMDVEDGLYRAWDSEGLPLALEVTREKRKRRWLPGETTIEIVVVREGSCRELVPDELRQELVKYLGGVGEESGELFAAPLSELIAKAKARFGPNPRHGWTP